MPVLGSPQPSTVPASEVDTSAAFDVDEVDSMLEELGGADGYTVSIFRRVLSGPNQGKQAYMVRVPLAGFTLDDLRRDYGGGSYVLKVVGETDGKIKKVRHVVIEGAPASAVVPSAMNETNQLLRTLLERQTAAPAAPTFGPQEMLTMFTGVMSMVREITPSSGGGGASAKELMDMYFRGKDDGLRDAPVSDGGLKSTLMDLGAPLLNIAQRNMAVREAELARASAAPVAPQQQIAEVPDVAPKWTYIVRGQIPALFQRAQAGKNPRVYANAMIEDLPEAALGAVYEAISQEDFVEQFVTQFPQFGQTAELREWIADFINEARESLREEEGGEDAKAS